MKFRLKNKLKPKMPGKAAMKLLKIGLPIISAALVILTVKFNTDAAYDPAKSLITYPGMYSHILASLTLLILGAVLCDVIEHEK